MSTVHPIPDPADDEPDLVTGFGDGGVPWKLLLLYLGFLTFLTWYTLEFQLPEFLRESERAQQEASEQPAEAGATEES